MALIMNAMPLTPRELDVLRLLCNGRRYADIARELGMTRNTAAGHLKSIYRKLDVNSAAAAVMRAVEMQLFTAAETLPKVKPVLPAASSSSVPNSAHRVTFRARR